MKILVHSLIVLMAIVLAGCNGLPFTNPSTTTYSPQQISGTLVPTSEKGKATVIGRAISSVTGKPYVDEFIRLAEVSTTKTHLILSSTMPSAQGRFQCKTANLL